MKKDNSSANSIIPVEKWEELLKTLKDLEPLELKEIHKAAMKGLKGKNKKNLFAVLLAAYSSGRYTDWNGVKRTVLQMKKNLAAGKRGQISRFFLKNPPEAEDHSRGDLTELFINIGRDKKIFPRDLADFICESMKIRPEEITGIKIFDSYSFFKVPRGLAEKAIVLLSVKKLRNKQIKVNYSKKKS